MKLNKNQERIISIIVENKPGVLYRTSNLLRRRNFNIQSLSVGPTEQREFSRMTIVVKGDELVIEQVIKQLSKLIDVIKITALDSERSVIRELALLKLNIPDAKARTDLINFSNIFRSRIVDVSANTMIVEVTGTPEKIDAFINLANSFGIKEMARTGLTALIRG